MNIGFVVYSQTSNTLSVVRRLQEKLPQLRHTAPRSKPASAQRQACPPKPEDNITSQLPGS